jgi:L-alanine-DL-glutamate epimerase-like enolase superfamily enzyme
LEYVEEPVHGVPGLAEVALASEVPIAMDETNEPAAGVTRVVVVKVTRGGITGALRAAEDAMAAGSDVVVASTMDGEAGIAAGLHLAAALRVRRHCGLATLPEVYPVSDSAVAVPSGPGLLGRYP